MGVRSPEYIRALGLARDSAGPHSPARAAYTSTGRSRMKWACAGCDYWTGYESKTKASRMILAHCEAKNTALGGGDQ